MLVVGADTRLGTKLVSRLCEGGRHRVSCVYSPTDDDSSGWSHERDTTLSLHREVDVDVTDAAAVASTISSIRPNTVVSCIGGDASTFVPGALSPYEEAAFRDLPAAKCVVDACVKLGVDKLVFVSMLGAGDSEPSVPFQVMATLRPLLLDLSDAEDYIRRQSELKWTIVRPAPIEDDGDDDDGGRVNANDLERVVITEDVDLYGTVSVRQFANALYHIVLSDNVARKTLHVVNRQRVLVTAPYVRPLEPWEDLPVTPASL